MQAPYRSLTAVQALLPIESVIAFKARRGTMCSWADEQARALNRLSTSLVRAFGGHLELRAIVDDHDDRPDRIGHVRVLPPWRDFGDPGRRIRSCSRAHTGDVQPVNSLCAF